VASGRGTRISEPLNVPATIDVIHRQLDEARDIETVLEIHDRAEALHEYCRRHDGLMEAGNRLAGITALCERRIGQELRKLTPHPAGRPPKNQSAAPTDFRRPSPSSASRAARAASGRRSTRGTVN
jgi:hypothetical protein